MRVEGITTACGALLAPKLPSAYTAPETSPDGELVPPPLTWTSPPSPTIVYAADRVSGPGYAARALLAVTAVVMPSTPATRVRRVCWMPRSRLPLLSMRVKV